MPLSDWDVILISTSAGKDSQAMLDVLVERATMEGVLGRVVAVHSDLGRVEWKGTRDLAEEQARHYGIRFEVVSRSQNDLLDHVEARGKWPSNKARYCTSDHKRGPIRALMTKLVREFGKRPKGQPVRILNCMGLRAEESPARSKRKPFEPDKGATNGKRLVYIYLPIHTWTTPQVWARIRRSGVRHHWAYDIGMPRLSCCFCVFSPRNGLLLAGIHNPELLDEYVAVEQRIDHKFTEKLTLISIKTAIANGEKPTGAIVWKRCA